MITFFYSCYERWMKPVSNTQEGAVLLESMIVDILNEYHQFKYVVIGMESTGFYGVHLAILSAFIVSIKVESLIQKKQLK